MSERSHHHNPAAHSRSRPTHAKRGGPSLTHRPYPTANPAISIASVPRQRWVSNRGKQTAAPLSSKRGTDENGASHSARRLPPQRHRVRALRPNKRRNDRVCHRVSNNEDTDPHTISNALLVLAMINKGKLYSYQNARFFKQTSQWRRKSWWCMLPAALILWHAGSDVMGCRRPTGGVFKYVSSDTSHAEAFPVATPRGRSSSSHEGERAFVFTKKHTASPWHGCFSTTAVTKTTPSFFEWTFGQHYANISTSWRRHVGACLNEPI